MKRLALNPSRFSFGASVLGHVVVLAAGLVGWNVARQTSFPVDAIEISSGLSALQAGAAHAVKGLKRPSLRVQRSNPVEIASAPRASQRRSETPAQVAGSGGKNVANQGQALTEWDRYRIRARSRIHEAVLYPRASKNLGEAGQVKVKFTVRKDGTISDVDVVQPSAFERLNLAAVETVRRVARLDPLPASFPGSAWSASVPIDFILR